MMDELLFPCLRILETMSNEDEKQTFLLHMAKAVGQDEEAIQLFLIIRSIPASQLFKSREISGSVMEKEFSLYPALCCMELLKDFPESYSKICGLCRYNSKYANRLKPQEQQVLSTILSNPSHENSKYLLLLKPCNFKSLFVFVAGSQLFILPLYQLLYRFIKGASSLTIPDNPLIDNLDTPNWQRIINTFMASSMFRHTVNMQQLPITVRDALFISIEQEYLALSPELSKPVSLSNDLINTLIKRKKYVPPVFGSPIPENIYKASDHKAVGEETISPILAPPVPTPSQNTEHTSPASAPSEFTGLSQKALDGLFSPLEKPRYSERPEQTSPIIVPEPVSPSPEENIQNCPHNVNGWFDVTQYVQSHTILPFDHSMIRDYLLDSYMQNTFTLDCAFCGGRPGLVFYIPGYGSAIWGEMEDLIFLIKNILSDVEIRSYSLNMVELIAYCTKYGLNNYAGLNSITAAYCAATDTPSLYPVINEIMSASHIKSMKENLIDCLPEYSQIYTALFKQAVHKSGNKGIKLWYSYETALASSIYLEPAFSLPERNLSRQGLILSEFKYSPSISKKQKGLCLDIRLHASNEKDEIRAEQDQLLLMNILSGLFRSRELTVYGLRLLKYTANQIFLFINSEDCHVISCVEDFTVKIISQCFRNFHYGPPCITLRRF